MGYSQKYFQLNQNRINAKRRDKYNSERRKAKYQENREQILLKLRQDRCLCPLCGLEYRRLYIKRHLIGRHKIVEHLVLDLLKPLTPVCIGV